MSAQLSSQSRAAPSLGAQLRLFRVRAGLSLQALAGRSGLGIATLKALEGDRRQRPHPSTVALLAEALGLDAADRDALFDLAGASIRRPATTTQPAAAAPSGAAALVYEVAWMRLLTLQMGHTVAATSTVLAAFMCGLALGGWLGGLAAASSEGHSNLRRYLRAYAALELTQQEPERRFIQRRLRELGEKAAPPVR